MLDKTVNTVAITAGLLLVFAMCAHPFLLWWVGGFVVFCAIAAEVHGGVAFALALIALAIYHFGWAHLVSLLPWMH
jgi:hypothetical protein